MHSQRAVETWVAAACSHHVCEGGEGKAGGAGLGGRWWGARGQVAPGHSLAGTPTPNHTGAITPARQHQQQHCAPTTTHIAPSPPPPTLPRHQHRTLPPHNPHPQRHALTTTHTHTHTGHPKKKPSSKEAAAARAAASLAAQAQAPQSPQGKRRVNRRGGRAQKKPEPDLGPASQGHYEVCVCVCVAV